MDETCAVYPWISSTLNISRFSPPTVCPLESAQDETGLCGAPGLEGFLDSSVCCEFQRADSELLLVQ